MLNPQPTDQTLNAIYGATYFIGSEEAALRERGNALKRATAKLQLSEIVAYIDAHGSKLVSRQMLEVGCGLGNFLIEARDAGFDVQGIDVSASAVATANAALGEQRAHAVRLEQAGFEAGRFDVVVLADVIEHVRNPTAFMNDVFTLLKPGGVVFMAVPSLDSLSARVLGRYWVEFKLEHLFYFNRKTVRRLLGDCNFEDVRITPGRKVLSLEYIIGHFKQFPLPVLTALLRAAERVFPNAMLFAQIEVVASGINAIARKPKA